MKFAGRAGWFLKIYSGPLDYPRDISTEVHRDGGSGCSIKLIAALVSKRSCVTLDEQLDYIINNVDMIFEPQNTYEKACKDFNEEFLKRVAAGEPIVAR
ncbi:MAG: hypothetical protein P4M15_00020 [Alphaproteobacteria bacterium]|nr:hypothetical protein [Alphaproteobacteria bacterium]